RLTSKYCCIIGVSFGSTVIRAETLMESRGGAKEKPWDGEGFGLATQRVCAKPSRCFFPIATSAALAGRPW
ncbi:MAG: hypothetical protein ABI222_15560, partial [Opitutaceae bacterium]